ncbi:MAG: T9SS type A sorting domain-containing protein, partial [Bacteroidota bacterium]
HTAPVVDEEGKIYLHLSAGFFSRFTEVTLNGESISDDRMFFNLLLRYSPSGMLEWTQKQADPWDLTSVPISHLSFDSIRQQLVLVQSEREILTGEDCNSQPKVGIQSFDLNGERQSMYSASVGGELALYNGAFSSNGNFVGLGRYRGEVNFGQYAISSLPDTIESDTCGIVEGLYTVYNSDVQRTISTFATGESNFFTWQMRRYDGFLYFLGVLNDELTLVKTTESFEYIGYLPLNQPQYADYLFRSKLLPLFDVSKGYITLVVNNFQPDSTFGVISLIGKDENWLGVLQIEDKGWKTDQTIFTTVEAVFPKANEALAVFPNPFTDKINVVLAGDANGATSFELLSLDGRCLLTGEFTSETVQEIAIPEISPGTYILRFLNGKDVFTRKVVKLP